MNIVICNMIGIAARLLAGTRCASTIPKQHVQLLPWHTATKMQHVEPHCAELPSLFGTSTPQVPSARLEQAFLC